MVAVADANPNIKDQVKKDFSCEFYTDYKEMLKKADINAVSYAFRTLTMLNRVLLQQLLVNISC